VAFTKALTALFEADLFSTYGHPVDGTRTAANVATVVEGGTVPFAFPETLRAAIDVRTLEGMHREDVLAELEGALRAAGVSDVSLTISPDPAGGIEPGPGSKTSVCWSRPEPLGPRRSARFLRPRSSARRRTRLGSPVPGSPRFLPSAPARSRWRIGRRVRPAC